MTALIRFFDLITSDAVTLTAAAVFALAVIGLLLVISWPSKDAQRPATSTRSATARSLAASGTSALEIARKTGLSRDAVALMATNAARLTRQNPPGAARSSLLARLTGRSRATVVGSQVVA